MKKFTCYLLIVCILLSISSVTIMAAGDLTLEENFQNVSEEPTVYDEETIKYCAF